MGVYWINLDRSTERHENMLTVLKDPVFDGMAKHRVKAIDGKLVTKEEIEYTFENVDEKQPVKEYCCFLSHIKALRQFSKSSHSIALILEDDISLDYKPYWQETIQDCIRNAPKGWELLQLCFTIMDNQPMPAKMYTHSKDTHYYGAVAYIVNKKGVRRFLKEPLFDKSVKHLSDHYLFLKMNTYVYKYPLFTYTGLDSTLHKEHIENTHLPSKQKIEKFLKNR
jgi:GR25 family glycosyltransferase involved in LPS biosynthesis